ncbi:ATP-dependent metallopeptidase FtsH/Yme1/Tma family protein [Roseburia hominis]|uniref:ATP-dependent metallopeptidase FtsH/Yme1/Tma family protein n=1 Tax=Roseburia hominis TaxID=301301 RepID=UPI001F1D5208|nr:ATP-dependent metallopeptidase FtsH/Yme1/Tma family protein [Roseburia hominis]
MKKRIKIIIAAAVAFFIVIILFFTFDDKGEYVPYTKFVSEVENGKISEVVISGETVNFYLENEDQLYYTDNPDYDMFKAELMLKGIQVTNEDAAEETAAYITDILFNLLFIGIVAFALYKVLSSGKKNFEIVKHTNVTFADIAGMKKEKQDMLGVLDMMKNPDKYKQKGIRPIKGIILEGPPGNGKTLFAKALAQEAGVNFIATRGADFQSAIMSIGPAKVKALFKKAAKHKPCIIFIDEFDGIGEARNYAGAGIDKENNRMIISLLNEMDGFHSRDGIMVIAATNSYASLDKALVRPGRFDRKYTISNPDTATRKELLQLYAKGLEFSSDLPIDKMAESMKGLSCSAIATIVNEAAIEASAKGTSVIDGDCIKEAYRKTRSGI